MECFVPAVQTEAKAPPPEQLRNVVRVAPSPGKSIVVRIAEDVFERLGWRDDGIVSVMRGTGAEAGKVRFCPAPEDCDTRSTASILHLPRSRARSLKIATSRIGVTQDFSIFSVPFDVDGDALTIDLALISTGEPSHAE